MLKIGVVLFAIGLLLISPLDEIFILIPLSAIYGVWVFPLFLFISLLCLIVGGVLVGKHILPFLENPIVMISIAISAIILIYLIISSGWLEPFINYL